VLAWREAEHGVNEHKTGRLSCTYLLRYSEQFEMYCIRRDSRLSHYKTGIMARRQPEKS
jgi:hypothetical protein